MPKLLWPFLIVNLRILGLIWRGATHFVQNSTTIILPEDIRRTARELPCRTKATHFCAKLEAWMHKMFHIFQFKLQPDTVLGTVNFLSWIFNAISSEKSCLTSVPFLLTYNNVRTAKIFPPCLILIGNSNFRRTSRVQDLIDYTQTV